MRREQFLLGVGAAALSPKDALARHCRVSPREQAFFAPCQTSGFTYPAGTIPHLGGYALASTFAAQTNVDKRIMWETGSGITTTGVWHPKIGYTTGVQSFSSVLSPGGTGGVSPNLNCWVQARADGAMLHDASGNEFEWTAGGLGRLVDPGNATWQADCLATIRNFLANGTGFEGVEFDNFQDSVNVFGGTTPNQIAYPVRNQSGTIIWNNDADFQAAQVSFMQNVGGALRDQGYFVTANGRPSSPTPSAWAAWTDRFTPYMSAVMIEYYLHHGQGSSSVWLQDGITGTSWNDAITWHEHLGTRTPPVGFTPIPDIRTGFDALVRYVSASYLLAWNGIPPTAQFQGGGALCPKNDAGGDTWNSNFDFDLGFPTAPREARNTADANNAQVWRRLFQKGYVYVNPSTSSKTVDGHTIPSGDALLVLT